MKKISFSVCLLCVGMMFTGCASDDPDFNPTTDGEETMTVTFEGSYWDALIDAPQYGGNLLYGTLWCKCQTVWLDGCYNPALQ